MKRKAFYAMSVALLGALVVPSCASQDNRITLIYRTWDTGTSADHNEERQLVEAFEKKENVKIHIVETPGSGTAYDENIKASYFTKLECADVLMLSSISFGLKNQYLYNIKEYIEADEEFNKVPASVRDACKFKSGYYAIPARLNLQGYFANTSLIENSLAIDCENLNVNSPYSKIEEIIDKAATVNSVVGVNSAVHYIDTMTSVLDTSTEKKMGYFTWDGEKYNLDSPAFIQGIQAAREIYDSHKSLDSYTDQEKLDLGIADDMLDAEGAKIDAWNKGKLALRYGATYEIKDMLKNKTLGNSYKFIGNPGGKISIVGDYYGVSATTEHPELAYKFAKWMSFGKDGFAERMNIYQKNNSTINTLPLQEDAELINTYFDKFGSSTEMRGLEDAYTYIRTKSMVEGVKVVPNYDASRNRAETGIQVGDMANATMFDLLNACVVGGQDITLYTTGTTNINTIANKQYTDWVNLYGNKYQ